MDRFAKIGPNGLGFHTPAEEVTRSIDLTAGGKYLTEDEMSLALTGSDHSISAWVKTNISQGVLIAFNTSIFGTRLVYFNNGKFCFYDEI